MKIVLINNNNITDPRINLSIEEYCLNNLDMQQRYLLFYVNEPSIIIGKNQNTLEEINTDFVKKNNIHVIRRMSGGGAVYHDFGNLNFSFISTYIKDKQFDFNEFTEPVIDALSKIGVHAEQSGRNDIVVNGKKISGNAQYSNGKSMVSHGTLLFESDIEKLVNALNVKDDKIQSKGLKSIKSRVANISDYLSKPMTMDLFKKKLIESIFEQYKQIPMYPLSTRDWKAINELSEKKYGTWEWNYGKSPEFNVRKINRFEIGLIDTLIYIVNCRITNIKFYGDFLGADNISDLENLLIGVRYKIEDVKNVLSEIKLNYYFGKLEPDRFVKYLFSQE
jgi:lipoate-protein ligase A